MQQTISFVDKCINSIKVKFLYSFGKNVIRLMVDRVGFCPEAKRASGSLDGGRTNAKQKILE